MQDSRKLFFNLNSIIIFCITIGLIILSMGNGYTLGGFQSNEKREVDMNIENENLILEISMGKKVYKIDETIEINCRFKNIGKSPLILAPILHPQTLNIYFGPSEEEMEQIHPRYFINELIKNIHLEPLKEYSFNEFLGGEGSLYNFRPPQKGTYIIFLVYENYLEKCKNESVWVGKIKSNLITIDIE